MLADLPLLDIVIDMSNAASPHQGKPALALFHGQVEWMRPPAEPGAPTMIGIQFCNLSVAQETAIIELIAHIRLGTRVPPPPEQTPPDG